MFEQSENSVDYSKVESGLPSTEPSNFHPLRDGSGVLVEVFSVETNEHGHQI